jgi:CHAT domain-containing protein/tetratricopeptide (TPR) repeat protein
VRAESIARTLLAEAESTSGEDSLDAARAIDLVVASLVRAGRARVPETGELARRAVAIKEKALGPDHPELAASVYDLAEQLRMSGEYPEARASYERARAIREKALAPDPADLIESLRGLGTFLYTNAEYAKARALYDRALTVAEASLGPDHPDVALILVDIARVLRTTGDFTDGRPLLDRALAIQEKALGADHVETAYTLRELGEMLRLSGDYAAARPAFERALAIRERALGPDHLEVADVLTGLGVLLRRVGIARDHTCPEALPVCERAIEIAEKTLGPDHPELVGYLEGLGWATFQCSDSSAAPESTEAAQRLFERSLAILEKTFGRDHLACTDTLEGLGFTAWIQGDPESAIQWYRRKLAIERSAFGPDNVAVGFTLLQLAYALNRRALALTPVIEPRAPRGHSNEESTLTESVVDTALESERISREHARLTGRSLAESEALRFTAARWGGGLALALNLSARRVDPDSRRKTLDSLVRSRALVLDTVASRHGAILHANDPEVERLARVMEAARARLANLTVRGSREMDAEERRKTLDDARRQNEDAERALAAKSAGFAAVLERSSLGLDDVIASLPPSSALVAYSIYHNWPYNDGPWLRYVAFVVRAGERFPAAIPLGPEEEIDRLVADWRRQISTPPAEGLTETASREAGERLRRKIWDPLRDHLGDAKRVFVVPDGALNTVSFAALPVGRNGYLVEKGPILHYLSSERDLVPPTKTERGDGLLAVGGPAYEATSLFASLGGEPAPSGDLAALPLVASARPYRGPRSACESFQKMQFAPLPETEKEASRLVELWNQARRDARDGPDASRQLLGAEASESAFKRLAPGRRILHLATHGFFLGGACASALDTASRRGLAAPTGAGENPLLLSGLALAGANHRAAAGSAEEDGILTAEEIAALDLSGVEWAVLSACDTASGDIRAGEGVLGLQRAFQIAGARTLVMSLWQVDDKATRRWMQELYEGHLRRGLDTAAAVRGAMLSVLTDRRRKGLNTHPFYWAGFIAAGDWR